MTLPTHNHTSSQLANTLYISILLYLQQYLLTMITKTEEILETLEIFPVRSTL